MTEVIPATLDEAPVLANLLELYAHDFSEFYEIELGPDGRFGYASLPLYWQEEHRHPFLIKVDGNLAGFALITKVETVWDMAEFFILRRYRHRGTGKNAAHLLWRQYPGPWQIRVMESNRSALPFWQRTISECVGEGVQSVEVEKTGRRWRMFSFESTRI